MAKQQTPPKKSSGTEAKRAAKKTNKSYIAWAIGGIISGILLYNYYGYGMSFDGFKAGLNAFKELVTKGAKEDKAVPANVNAPVKETPKWTWKDGPKPGAKMLSDHDIRYVDGGKPLLVIIGQVFDVTKGFKMYAPGSGYHGFIGRDASRAFVTGDFTEKGLVSNVDGLTSADYDGLAGWIDFYFKDYEFVGYHIGRFFNQDGKETKDMADFKAAVRQSEVEKKAEANVKNAFPPCNSAWNHETGSKFSCSKQSGGIARDWEGYPHLFTEDGGKSARCACIKELNSKDRRIRPYKECSKDSKICYVRKEDQ